MISPDALTALAAQVTTALAPVAPFLVKASEGAASQMGKDAWEQAKKLFEALKARFQQDKNAKGEKALANFVEDPETYEGALAKVLLAALQEHPEWANEVRETLAKPALQEIVLRNKSHAEEVTQLLTGSGTQRLGMDNSTAGKIKQEKK